MYSRLQKAGPAVQVQPLDAYVRDGEARHPGHVLAGGVQTDVLQQLVHVRQNQGGMRQRAGRIWRAARHLHGGLQYATAAATATEAAPVSSTDAQAAADSATPAAGLLLQQDERVLFVHNYEHQRGR